MSIAEQMGRTLQKTSVSLNIKERLDFSCAIFGPDGGLVANAPHGKPFLEFAICMCLFFICTLLSSASVPVHLGSMQNCVRYLHQTNYGKLKPGDVLVSNHPGMCQCQCQCANFPSHC